MCLPALCLAYLFKASPDTVATSTTRQAPSCKRQPSCTGPCSILALKALGASLVITGTGLDTGSTGKSGAQAACDRGVTEGWPRPYTSAHRITEAVELHGKASKPATQAHCASKSRQVIPPRGLSPADSAWHQVHPGSQREKKTNLSVFLALTTTNHHENPLSLSLLFSLTI